MATAFGPQGPNFSTTRPPADPQASAGADTWFKNCSAAGAKDGTVATAAWFNVYVANLRRACNDAGIALDDTNDAMLSQAITSIATTVANTRIGSISGGSGSIITDAATVHYGVASGTSTLTATVNNLSTLADGDFVALTPTANNPGGGVTLQLNSLSALPVQYKDGTNLFPNELQTGQPVLLLKVGGVYFLESPPNPTRSVLFQTNMTVPAFAVANQTWNAIPMASGAAPYGTFAGSSFVFLRAGLYGVSASTNVGVTTTGGSNVNSAIEVVQNGNITVADYDNSFDQGGLISPTVGAVGFLEAAIGDTVQVLAKGYAAGSFSSATVNAGQLQLVALN